MTVDLSSDELVLFLTTEEDSIKAHYLANILIKEKLVACISFNKIESLFWWNGEINKSKEVQLMIKTRKENIQIVTEKILECHSYSIPEIIHFPVLANSTYFKWSLDVMN